MKRQECCFVLLLIVMTFVGCQSTTLQQTTETTDKSIQFAKNFTIEKKKGYTVLTVKNPWKGASQTFRYIVHPKEEPTPSGYEDATFISTPITSIACLSTTHLGLLNFLDAGNLITSMSGTSYVYDKTTRARIKAHKIKELGSSETLNYEILVDTAPDIVLLYSLGADNNIAKMKELGLKPVIIAEYMDHSPLARAEWVKFLALLLGKEELANTKFEKISSQYMDLKQLIEQKEKPTVFTGMGYEGNWYVPGGESYVSRSIQDAGGNYLWKNQSGHSSIMLDLEAVFDKARDAEVWINVGVVKNKQNIVEIDERYGEFEAFRSGRIFNGNARVSKGGGYDIYESAVVNPHLVLKDLIQIFHPSLLKDHTLFYYKQLN